MVVGLCLEVESSCLFDVFGCEGKVSMFVGLLWVCLWFFVLYFLE